MKYSYTNKNEVLNTEHACAYLLAATANNDIVELHLKKNGMVPVHALPIDVSFFVISGEGEITIDGKAMGVSKGDVIEVKKDLDRTWENPFSNPLILLVIKQKT